MAWTFRQDVAAGLYTMLSDFMSANPTFLNGVYRSRPTKLMNRPLAYVGGRNETLQHTTGIHRRTITPQVVIVYRPQDQGEELADVRDDVVDAFLEYASSRPHAVTSRTLVEPRADEDVELELDGVPYPATIITFLAVDQVGAQTGA